MELETFRRSLKHLIITGLPSTIGQ